MRRQCDYHLGRNVAASDTRLTILGRETTSPVVQLPAVRQLATLESAFPALPEQGWAAFAATEDVNDPDAHPGTTLEETRDGCVLNGYKSWVGHSRLVDHMVITVNDPGGDKYQARGMVLPAARAGVTLSHRDRPKFLAAMSQGFAKFNDTPIALDEIFPFLVSLLRTSRHLYCVMVLFLL